VDNLELHIEALIFASEKSISVLEIKQVAQTAFEQEFTNAYIEDKIGNIKNKYIGHAIELVQLNGGYQFLTRSEFHTTINQLQVNRSKKKLSQASLETLAIVAYKQPITKLEIEQIRGVNCDYTVQRLLEKELIAMAGKANTVGKPILYALSNTFMDYFGINSVDDLPKMNDLINGNQIGTQPD
jgi:segregation and condensation protein B